MLRGHLTEYGLGVQQGATNTWHLVALVAGEQSALPTIAQFSLAALTEMLAQLDKQIKALDAEIGRCARESAVAQRLMTIPGIGPLIATATATPAPEAFRNSRDFAAWLGLTPRQRSAGG